MAARGAGAAGRLGSQDEQTYDRHDYVAEKQQALAQLAALVGRIVRQGPGVARGAHR
jgi:hypothetical protein